jgi:hypothetical protein
MASRAIPSHLKPSSAAGKDEGGFNSQRHHGKSQSHVVSHRLIPAALQYATPFTLLFVLTFKISLRRSCSCTSLFENLSLKDLGGRLTAKAARVALSQPLSMHQPLQQASTSRVAP